MKLTKEEREIEESFLRGEYVPVPDEEFKAIVKAIEAKRREVVLNIRVNGKDLKAIKKKANRLGVKYQSFISEILHRVAQASL